MKSLATPSDKQQIIDRITVISGNEKALWGTMSVDQMVCHLTDQIRVAIGEKDSNDVSNFALKNIAKNLILLGMPTPKGKIETVPEMSQKKEGTPPTELQADKKTLIETINTLCNSNKLHPHPAFGKMSKKQWYRLCYLHLDHHLKQFGV